MKSTKKLIAVILAVLMVFTTAPLSAFAANSLSHSKDDAVATELKTAITTYETKMDGTLYKNMSTAYTAYVSARKAYAAYVYGNASIDLSTYTKTLNNALTAMTPWTAATFGTTGYYADSVATGGYSNVVYSSKTLNISSKYADKGYVETKLAAPKAVVFAYDGRTANNVYGPVMFEVMKTGASWQKKQLKYAEITDASSFALKENWTGYWSKASGAWNVWPSSYENNDSFGYSSSIPKNSVTVDNTKTSRYYWNKLHYTGSGNTNTYYDSVTSFSAHFETTNNDGGANSGVDSAQYVINYKPVIDRTDALKTALTAAFVGKTADDYLNGGLTDILAEIDTFTADSLNPNTYSYTDDNAATQVAACATAIKNAVAAYGDGDKTVGSTGVVSGYKELSERIEEYKATYCSSDEEVAKYTSDSWAAFTAAYEAAQKVFVDNMTASVPYNNNADAQDKADKLVAAKLALKTNFKAADTTSLEAVIDDAAVALNNKDLFVSSSFDSTLESNVAAAKVAVWGSEDKYKNDAARIDETKQSVVNDWETTITNQLLALEISKDAKVSSAQEYSLNSAVAYEGTLKSTDYANYSAVTTALNECKKFYEKILTYSQGAVAAKIEEYKTVVANLVSAIVQLKPAFSKIANGQIANEGSTEVVSITSSIEDGKFALSWARNNNIILFRTSAAAATYNIGKSTFQYTVKADYDSLLDSINLADAQSNTGKLTNSNKDTGWGLTSQQQTDYPGGISPSNNNITYAISNIKVTNYTGQNTIAGRSADGTEITDLSHVYDDDIKTTNGTDSRPDGGIISHSSGDNAPGVSEFVGDNTISVSRYTSKNLTASTIPTYTTYNPNTYFGMLYHWKVYGSAFTGTYNGYAHDRTAYEAKIDVVDVSYLMKLFETVDALNANDYTVSSWNNLTKKLEAAKADFDYSSMTAEAITAECVTRYKELYAAWQALQTPLTNTSIETALGGDTIATALASERGTLFANDNADGKYTTTSYTAFKNAYTAAYAKVFDNGEYSDENVRAIEFTDADKADKQALIDSFATALDNAFAALKERASFTALDAAANDIQLEDKAYTVASLKAIADKLNNYEYLNKTADERADIAKADAQTAIDAETTEIQSLKGEAGAPVDDAAIEAAKAKVDADDPDAVTGVEDAKKAVEALYSNDNLYEYVTIRGKPILGIKYTQKELDAQIQAIVEKLQPQQYTVTVVTDSGEQISTGTYDYGSMQSFTSGSYGNVDWYYAYQSNTTSNTAKYYTTDSVIRFVVKGNTTLTIKSAKTTANQYQIKTVNGLTNSTVDINYVQAGNTYTLPEAPAVPYYTFKQYTVDGQTYAAGATITPTKNTVVTAEYTATQDNAFSLTVHYDVSGDSSYNTLGDGLTIPYNAIVSITQDGMTHSDRKAKQGAYIAVDGEKKYASSYTNYKKYDDPIVAFATVDYSIFDDFYGMWESYVTEDLGGNTVYSEESKNFAGKLKIVSYGSEYTFRMSGDTYILPLNQTEYNNALAAGLIKNDENGADVTAKEDLVYTSTKFSMIGTYALPQGATLVEAGILFAKNQTSDLTFKNVDSTSVYRLKSSKHTEGNQFVISIKNGTITEGQQMRYAAYVIYEKGGKQYSVVSTPVDATYTAAK